jgi:predicted ATPase/DNA-binding winged helix-turn-helix (wHTH) protein
VPAPIVFGPFRLDRDGESLWRGDERVPLQRRPFAVLRYLAEHPGRLITKDELLDAVWPGVFVGDASIKVAIREVRRALDDAAGAPGFIETVHGRGYRFRPPPRGTRLPVALTSFVGRERERQAIGHALDGSRLVTLRGVGGCGKTRLACEVALERQSRYADGIWWIDLGGVDRPDLVVPAIAATIGIRNRHDRGLLDTLGDFVSSRELLLVFDTCEHLAGECAAVAKALLTEGPSLSILATSRQPLGVAGERVFVVPPLEVPGHDGADEVRRADAVRLFIERAHDADPRFQWTDEAVPVVRRICQRLDGLPLAIELVAARAGAFALTALLARLEETLTSFPGHGHAGEARHRSLHAAIAWSDALLNDHERQLLRQLSVFASTFSLDAVSGVCALTEGDARDVLSSLVDQSLVTVVGESKASGRRYRLLDVVREYARNGLQPAEHLALASRHAAYFTRLAAACQPHVNGAERGETLAALSSERDNFRAALDALLQSQASQALDLAASLWWWWLHTNQWQEGRAWLEASLARAGVETASRAEALCGAGALAWFQGEHAVAELRLEEAVRQARATGPVRVLSRALDFLGQVRADRRQIESALTMATEATAVARRAGDRWELAISLLGLGNVLFFAGRGEEARAAYRESAALCRAIPDPWALGMALRNLGALAREAGDLAASARLLCDSLQALAGVGEQWFVSRSLEELAKTLALTADVERAARLFGAAEVLRERIGATVLRHDEYARAVANVRGALGDARFGELWTEGRALDRDAAIRAAIPHDTP